MKTRLSAIALSLGLSLFAVPSHAFADGLAVKPAALKASVKTSLETDIAAAKVSKKAVRDLVRNVQGVRPEVYKQAQNPVPEASRELSRLGNDALMPMLESLAFDASQRELAANEREALTVGMLFAVGKIRDAKASPVLRAVFESQTSSTAIATEAAVALGKLCGDAEREALKAQLGEGKPLRQAAVAGLAECRNADAVTLLAPIAKDTSSAIRIQAVKSLGTVGSSWAWRTHGEDKQAEALAVRNAAATALLEAFIANADTRTEAKRAMLRTESTTLFAKVQSAKAAATDADVASALASLEKSLEKQAKRINKK